MVHTTYVCVFNFGYMYVCNSVHVHCMQSITDEGNRGLVKRLEKSVSLWASVSEQPKYACTYVGIRTYVYMYCNSVYLHRYVKLCVYVIVCMYVGM